MPEVSSAIEFDGPSHFLACRSLTGAMLMKHRHLRQLGYVVVVVPYWHDREWDQVCGDEASKVEYLRGKLRGNGEAETAAKSNTTPEVSRE